MDAGGCGATEIRLPLFQGHRLQQLHLAGKWCGRNAAPTWRRTSPGRQECRPNENDISAAAQEILDIRRRYLDVDKSCSLATLYDPLTMPPELVKAHAKLDALVDKAYGRTFASDAERVAYLFNLYAEAVIHV